MRYAATAYLWQLHSNENRPFQGPPKMPDGRLQGCEDARMLPLGNAATTATTTSREISRSHKHEPSTCNCHALPLSPCCCEGGKAKDGLRLGARVRVSVSGSGAMCRRHYANAGLSSGQTAHCNLHLNDPGEVLARSEISRHHLQKY